MVDFGYAVDHPFRRGGEAVTWNRSQRDRPLRRTIVPRGERREDRMWADNFEGSEERRPLGPFSGLEESREAGKAIM